MFHALVVPPAHPEAHRIPDVVHDALNICAQLFARHIDEHGFIAASDVIANARWANRVLVRYNSADRHRIALMMIGHQRDSVCGARARFDLRNRAILRVAPHRNSINKLHFAPSKTIWRLSRTAQWNSPAAKTHRAHPAPESKYIAAHPVRKSLAKPPSLRPDSGARAFFL